ncbi:MAG: hypothetical protein QXU74_02460 [Candidatus Aenigmatarchaeota archaeon]
MVVCVSCRVCSAKDTALAVCSICGKDVCIEKCAVWHYYSDEDKALKWKRVCVECKAKMLTSST